MEEQENEMGSSSKLLRKPQHTMRGTRSDANASPPLGLTPSDSLAQSLINPAPHCQKTQGSSQNVLPNVARSCLSWLDICSHFNFGLTIFPRLTMVPD